MLKDLFQDYLVNYTTSTNKSLIDPYSEEVEIEELPDNRYKRLLAFLDTKKTDKKTEEPKQDNTFVRWVYSEPKNDTPETSVAQNVPYSDSNKWVADMTAAYKRQGLSDNAIKNLLAKNSLESNWGTSTLSRYNNFGGITAGRSWKGDIIESGDKDKNGNPIKQKFRSYKSLDDYVKDEIQFLTNLYDFDQNDDINTFLSKLQGNNKGKRSYAEDPSYKNKIKQRYLKI